MALASASRADAACGGLSGVTMVPSAVAMVRLSSAAVSAGGSTCSRPAATWSEPEAALRTQLPAAPASSNPMLPRCSSAATMRKKTSRSSGVRPSCVNAATVARKSAASSTSGVVTTPPPTSTSKLVASDRWRAARAGASAAAHSW